MIAFVRCTVIPIGLALLVQSQSSTVLFGPLPANSLDLYVEKTGLLSGKKHHFVFTRLDMTESVEFTIQSASITCRDTWVKNTDIPKIERVAKKDLLAIDKCPSIRFQSTSIQALQNGKYRVTGMLQVRDLRKPSTFSFNARVPSTRDQRSSTHRLRSEGAVCRPRTDRHGIRSGISLQTFRKPE